MEKNRYSDYAGVLNYYSESSILPVSRGTFLKDVLICSLGAYGGPETHISVFLNQMVQKKGYLAEEELIELLVLNGMLLKA